MDCIAQAKFKPAPDRWSILECAEHIAQAEQLLFADAINGLNLPPDSTTKAKSSGDYDPIGRWPDLASIEKVFD